MNKSGTDMPNWTRRRILQGTGATVLTLGAGHPRTAAAQDDALYTAAKKEGRLTRYDGIFEQKTIEAIIAAFTAKYPGIDVQLLRQPSQTLYTRLRLEMQHGVAECDTLGSMNIRRFLERNKIGGLESYAAKEGDKPPASFRDLD